MGHDDPAARRYHRQSILPGIGEEGQRALGRGRVVLIGCGALGTVVADALVRAGVGCGERGEEGGGGGITIVDRDVVEWTNLQRQVLFDERDARAGAPKATAAAERLKAVNSAARIDAVIADFNPRNAERICRGAVGDRVVVVDGTDNFQTRYLINDVCVKLGVPLVYGGVVGTVGMTMTVRPGATPCLRCVFPEMPAPGTSPTCDTAGVLGPMAGIVGAIQAVEAMKILLGRTDLLRPVLSQFDVWNNQRRTIELASVDRSACACCTGRRFEFLDADAAMTTSPCGADAVQVLPARETRIDLGELARRLTAHGEFAAGPHLVRGQLRDAPGFGLTVFADGRAIVRGTTDAARARSIYARFVGS